ncbi:MAG: hypothetical protein CL931_10730 [Deltaproteobacteria bacterium]|nr:hypothetical protein [Deltaproteobacteria bacterium]
MLTTFECAGHPRDMGLAQGAALRDALRSESERLGLPLHRSRMPSLRPLAIGAVRGVGAGREMFRHFAHLAERLEGVAKSADLPLDTVLELHLRIREGGERGGLLARRAVVRASAEEGSASGKCWCLERTLPVAAEGEAGWVLRESRPQVGYRSVEVTLPWLVSSVAGVNEAGLAVVAAPLLWGAPGREGNPTSLLLVQECLQRFPDLEGALDWCRKRPVEGEQSLVLADANGDLATVAFSGRDCRVLPGDGELQLEGGEPFAQSGETSEDQILVDPVGRRLHARFDGLDVDVEVD